MNATTARPALTADQAQRADRARQVLAEQSPSMYELVDMAERIGRLEWHLGELLALVDELAAAKAYWAAAKASVAR
jgi:hypothetical protein